MDINPTLLAPVQAALEQWTDNRVIHADDLEDLLLYILHVHSVFVNSGLVYMGSVFRQKEGQTLLTVKAVEGTTPLVVFITAGNPTSCIRRFWDLWHNDKVPWVRDRYPWI
jgi:hypothetical protein